MPHTSGLIPGNLINETNPETHTELDNFETIYSGKVVDIVGIPIKHQGITEDRVDRFQKAVSFVNPDAIVAEYFDPDMPDEVYNRVVTNGSNKYSAWEIRTLLEFAGIDRKVICVDPAHDNTWLIVDGVILELGFLGVMTSSMLLNEIAIRQKADTPKQLNRRDFIKGVAWTAFAAGIAGTAPIITKYTEQANQTPINFTYNPQATRRLVIARNLLKLDELMAKNSKTNSRLKLGLMYPQTHIEGIREFLNTFNLHNEAEAEVITRLSDYSTARIYTPDYTDPNDKKWKKSNIKL